MDRSRSVTPFHGRVAADPRQRKNRAGGYTFVQVDFARLHRFLTLVTTGGTYYASEHELTRENAGLIVELATKRAAEVVAAVLDISLAGRAPKQNPALFALAVAAKLGDDDGRRAALAAVPLVARAGTHLFHFAGTSPRSSMSSRSTAACRGRCSPTGS